jgi:hypothetical protein
VDVVTENGRLERISTPNTPAHLWQLHNLDCDTHGTDSEEDDCYYRVLRLSNGERVGIKCGLSSSASSSSTAIPSSQNFVMHVLQGHDRIYGVWLFARDSFVHSDYQVRPFLPPLSSCSSFSWCPLLTVVIVVVVVASRARTGQCARSWRDDWAWPSTT